jgi:acyl-CoA synthetase (AMP-forming)/AMP-acid ligase II
VQLPNISELVITYLALARIGAIISPASMQYGAFELQHQRDVLKPKAMIVIDRLGKNKPADALQSVAEGLQCYCFGDSAPGFAQAVSLDSLPATDSAALDEYLSSFNDDANNVLTICWTSGTTGNPKGVARSHNLWLASNQATACGGNFKNGDVFLCPFPFVNMSSIGSMFYNFLQYEATLVLHHPIDFPVFLQQLVQEKVSFTLVPPALLNRLLKMPEVLDTLDLSALRAIGSGSAPLSPWMVNEYYQRFGIDVINYFGSNEGLCLTSASKDVPDASARAEFFPRLGVEGLSWRAVTDSFTETRLVDNDTGEVVSENGKPGELQIRGASIFDGYYQHEDKDHGVFTEDGFFRSGDLFTIEGEGDVAPYYRFCGRCKDLIIRGGYNISPEELDTVLEGHPKLAEVAVCGYPDEELGERICAAVVVKEGETLALSDITDFLADAGVAKIKWPERLYSMQELPRNALNKIRRREIAAKLADEIKKA